VLIDVWPFTPVKTALLSTYTLLPVMVFPSQRNVADKAAGELTTPPEGGAQT
jgi:hypothetical protein